MQRGAGKFVEDSRLIEVVLYDIISFLFKMR
jgi:hypothetical protein